MAFPVDILGTLTHEDLELSAEDYMSELLHGDPDKADSFTLPCSRQIPISLPNVGFVPIYGADVTHKVLALFAPEDQFTAVALYLGDLWWAVEDILKTSDPSRTGLVKVRTLGERIVLYVLNRIVYRVKEIGKNEVPFLCHSQTDYAKILWKDGEAVGFYSVKPKDSLCRNFVTQRYLLPVMDSIFVKKAHRGRGHGLQMLEDFVDSFEDDALGLKYPLSREMKRVCRQYLDTYPADQDLLWEVESVGGPFQRYRVASKIQETCARGSEYSVGDATYNNDIPHNLQVSMEEEMSPETLEDVHILNEHIETSETLASAAEDEAVLLHTRSSELRRKRLREEGEQEESMLSKIRRAEDTEVELAVPIEEVLKDELSPVCVEGMEDSAPEALKFEGSQAEEVELLNRVEPEQMNGEQTGSTGEAESEASDAVGHPAASQGSSAQGETEELKDTEGLAQTDDKEDSIKVVSEQQEDKSSPPEEIPSDAAMAAPADLENLDHLLVEEEIPSENQEESPSTMHVEEAPLEKKEEALTIEVVPLEKKEEAPSTMKEVPSHLEDMVPSEMQEGAPSEMEKEVPFLTEEASSQELELNIEAEENEKEPGFKETSIPDVVEKSTENTAETELGQEVKEERLSIENDMLQEADTTRGTCPPVEVSEDRPPVQLELCQETVLLVGLKEVSYELSELSENEDDQDTGVSQERTEEEENKEEELQKDEGTSDRERVEEALQEDMPKDEEGKVLDEAVSTEDEKTSATEEEPDSAEKSQDSAEQPAVDTRVLRKRTARVTPPASKRKAKRTSKATAVDDAEASEGPEDDRENEAAGKAREDEEEEQDEEKATTTEEDVAEKTSGEEDEPPMVDRRVLRRKGRAVQTPPKPKAKRRSKV